MVEEQPDGLQHVKDPKRPAAAVKTTMKRRVRAEVVNTSLQVLISVTPLHLFKSKSQI